VLRRWLFALVYDRVVAGYERWAAARKRALLGGLRGTVLEIGPGTGANLAHFHPSIRWVGLEPSAPMRTRLARKARGLGLEPRFLDADGTGIPLADASVDAVVSTLVLCTVPDPRATVGEVRRVLRPEGRFVFLEHVAAPPGSRLARWQGRLRPTWAALADGCQLDRDLESLLRGAGFRTLELEAFRVPSPPGIPLIACQIAGTATR